MYFQNLNENLKLYIASKVLNREKTNLIAFGFNINEEMEQIAKDHILNHKPLSKIFKEKYFWDRVFYTNEHTLDPRQETELIIETFIKKHDNKMENLKILELGVGSGAVIATILSIYTNSTGIGIDISDEALKVAEKNTNNIKDRIQLRKHNWLEDFQDQDYILISNPPYLNKKDIESAIELQYDPFIALYGGEDRMYFYNKIAEKSYLFKEIYMEIANGITSQMIKLFNHRTYEIVEDLLGCDRLFLVT